MKGTENGDDDGQRDKDGKGSPVGELIRTVGQGKDRDKILSSPFEEDDDREIGEAKKCPPESVPWMDGDEREDGDQENEIVTSRIRRHEKKAIRHKLGRSKTHQHNTKPSHLPAIRPKTDSGIQSGKDEVVNSQPGQAGAGVEQDVEKADHRGTVAGSRCPECAVPYLVAFDKLKFDASATRGRHPQRFDRCCAVHGSMPQDRNAVFRRLRGSPRPNSSSDRTTSESFAIMRMV